ncbi:MAG: nucleotidyltransferase family protein [Pseudohongiellaceae bacterium]
MNRPLVPQDVGILILAAGSSHRFGGDKREALLDTGRSLLETTMQQIPDSFIHKALVLRSEDARLAKKYSKAGWQICVAQDAGLGMGHSLAAGIAAVEKWPAVLIGLGDMPYIRGATYGLLQEALCRHSIVAPLYQSRRGNPVGFRQQFFPELETLQGDLGARNILEKHAPECHMQDCDDPGILKDVDRPEQL